MQIMPSLITRSGMKKPETAALFDPDIERAEQRGYRLGVRAAEQHAQRLLDCMCRTNRTLLDMVRLLDTEYPICGVTISFDLAERTVKALRGRPHGNLAAELQDILDHTDRAVSFQLAGVERELLELVG